MSDPVFTVSTLNREIKQLLESHLGQVWLSGEISNLATPASGHLYFTLKDDRSQLRCAMFRGRATRTGFKPSHGQQVLVRANLTLYEPRGDIQLVVESMQPAGDGLLQQQYEALKMRLAAEGLFSSNSKKPLPNRIATLGVITSASGAAIHDVLSVLQRRDPMLKVVIYPSLVQGRDATPSLCQAIATANARNEVDCLLLTRGGGSLEDLWCFNEEALARAVFASALPIVSAVGHEVDTTIVDYVADVRAPTPSAAAELLSQDRSYLLQRSQQLQQQLLRAMRDQIRHQQHQLALLTGRVHAAHPKAQLQTHQQRLDELSLRLSRASQQHYQQAHTKQQQLAARLAQQHPQRTLTLAQVQLQQLEQRLLHSQRTLLKQRYASFNQLCGQLEAVSPLAVLRRGYAIVSRQDGQVVKEATQLRCGESIEIRLHQGAVQATVNAS